MASLALCIPAYNASCSLKTLFSSVHIQIIPFDEILLYNDCSTDDTTSIASALGATVIEGDINRGCSYGKNQLAKYAKSDWLFFLDSDDELMPGFTTTARKWMNMHDGPEIVLIGYSYVNFKTGEILSEPNYNREVLAKDPLRFMITNKIVNSSLIRKDVFLALGGFDLDPDLLYIEDRAFSIRMGSSNASIDIEPTVCFKINFFPESMSTAKPGKWILSGVELWKKTFKKAGHEYADDICDQLFENAVWAAKYNAWDIVKKSLVAAKKIKPGKSPRASRIFLLFYKIFPFGAFYLRAHITRYYKKLVPAKA